MADNLINKSVAELAGAFVLITVILNMTNGVNTGKSFSDVAIPIGLALAGSIFLFGGLSGGHFNPAVSLTMYFKDSVGFPLTVLITYILAQCIGGLAALQWFKMKG